MTKQNVLEALKQKLATDTRWAKRALLAIYKNQTADEQIGADVVYHNQMGFRCMDAMILTSLANQLKQRGTLSEKQMRIVFKLMPVYARQLIKFYGSEKIEQSLQPSAGVHAGQAA
jgi:hypothetical protein